MKEKVAKLFSTVKSMWDKPLEGRYLNIKELLSFGVYALGNSWIYNTIMLVVTITQIPQYYQIGSIHGYLIWIAGSLINMLLLPVIGQSMEKKVTRFGKYKPYILFTLPLLALFTMLSMWVPQYGVETERIIFAYCTCVPVIAVSTFANNMYQTMPSVITPNNQERTDIMTPIGLVVGFAPTIMNVIVGPIQSAFIARGEEYMAFRVIGAIAVVIGVLCVLFIVKVKERVYQLNDQNRELLEAQAEGRSPEDEAEKRFLAEEDAAEAVIAEADAAQEELTGSKVKVFIARIKANAAKRKAAKAAEKASPDYLSFADSMKMLAKNKPLWILFAAMVIGSLREFWVQFYPMAIRLRFAETTTAALNISGIPNTIIGFGATVAMLLLPFLTRKLSKNWVLIIFSAVTLIPVALLGFIGFENIPQGTTSAVVLTLLFFIARINPTTLIIPVLLGDVADYQQYKTGRRLEGHLQNFIMVIPVLMSFIFMLLGWIWQTEIGFEPFKYQNLDVVPPELQSVAMEWFDAAYLLNAASLVGMIIILCFYPLSRKKLAEVAEALRKASVNADEMGAGEMKLAVETSGAGEGVTESVSESESLEIIEYTAQDDAPTDTSAEGGQDAGGFLDGSGGDDSGK